MWTIGIRRIDGNTLYVDVLLLFLLMYHIAFAQEIR
jgi:hypothetical protein